ncbi:CRISPR-associated protein Csc3 [Rippkaea orientalis PCC 8801]|uniref:CRISPR-associated protein Csc3 n=1 Tax=Rippkaea orientalis (strain PCC 8801 / RF-1) TaxID=41431 RepID=B7JVM9_RIPO1|nr:type I-D CRISPR-associated protein Cas10d/Csc3 [Rippkaea orientalis]ACK64600.1 CRISPR-associated protein Csc3 [Rippkaea orientalis PCC 8801]
MTLLQILLLETISQDTDPILISYLETVLPAMEPEFALIPALGGSQQIHYQNLIAIGNRYAQENAKRFSDKADQNLLVHVLNALLTAWNLVDHLTKPLSDIEKYLLCLGLTLHDYNKYCLGHGEESPKVSNINEIINICQELGKKLNFQAFWSDWEQYLPEIVYLAQNTQFKAGTNAIPANYPLFTLADSRRLDLPLRRLLAFGDIAVHLQDPADIISKTGGDRLREHLRFLGIKKALVYHRLRDTLGILSNGIHNATLRFAKDLNWQPLLFFAQGVIYLAPIDYTSPEKMELQGFIWQEISQLLASSMLKGEIGFKRDGKGLKVAPQTLELFTPVQLIRNLADVINVKVANAKVPATPKRLEKLELTEIERQLLEKGADLRADRIAELIILAQREFLADSPEFIDWTLQFWGLEKQITAEQTQEQSGGVNYGWYRVAANYIANHFTLSLEDVSGKLVDFCQQLADWATSNQLLSSHSSSTFEVFNSYLEQYLEIQGWQSSTPNLSQELSTYIMAKTQSSKQPICSLSSGEFISEDQMDSVVLFKPQQYSNKNPLGGGKIKRGISKIWALEMLLRQALWTVPSGKFEDQQPVFLYIFPAYVYSPQIAAAIRSLVNDMKRVNLWDVRKHWLHEDMNLDSLRSLQWRKEEAEVGRFKDKYSRADIPFMGTVYTTTRGKTLTEAWIDPAFLTLALPILLGVKVIATSSSVPLYNSDNDFLDSVILDAPAGFWQLLKLSTSLRIQELSVALKRLLTIYTIHLDNRSNPPDARWQALNSTVREVITDVLNVFSIADEKLREDQREASPQEVQRYWKFAEIFAQGDTIMTEKLKLTKELVRQYRTFYQVKWSESSHTILLPLTKALEEILSTPEHWDDEELILQGAGILNDALDRQEVYKRPLLQDKSIPYEIRKQQELQAIHQFMTTCVKELFGQMCKGDRALLQEYRNRIKSGAESAYKLLAFEEKSNSSQQQKSSEDQ